MTASRRTSRVTLIASALFLLSCGGGGGGPSGGAGSSPSAGTISSPIVLNQVTISPSDILATTKYQSNVAFELSEYIKYAFNKMLNLAVPTAYAVDSCGDLCLPGNPQVNIDTAQQLTSKLVSGSLLSLSPIFIKKNSADSISCNFANAGILVNKIYLINNTTKDSIANLTIPTSVDTNCNLKFESADYFINGSTGKVYLMETQITSQILDVIPSGDQAFNTSNNPLVVDKNGDISEIGVSSTGVITQVAQLTASSAPLVAGSNSSLGVQTGSLAYDGNYLVGPAKNFSGLLIYEKGNSSFRILRDNFGGSYYSIFINSDGNFVWGSASSPKKVINLNDLSLTEYAPSGARPPVLNGYPGYPAAMYGARGRYNSTVMSDRCMLWDTTSGAWMSLLNFPNAPSGGINDNLTQTDFSLVGNARYGYSKISSNYAYCAASTSGNGVPNYFARYDIQTNTKIGVNLDSYGFLPTDYQIFSDKAYAIVTNITNSDVQYIQINLQTGAVTNLGVIVVGTRKVTKLSSVSGYNS